MAQNPNLFIHNTLIILFYSQNSPCYCAYKKKVVILHRHLKNELTTNINLLTKKLIIMKKFFSFCFLLTLAIMPVMAWDNLYVIGDGTSAGWSTDNAKEMTKVADDEFYLTDYYFDGEIKFLTEKDFSKTSYGPTEPTWKLLSVMDAIMFTEGDHKFERTENNKGWSTLHINTTTMKISTWPVYIYPVGDGTEAGWSTDGNYSLKETSFGSGIYSGEMTIKNSGELKFLHQTGAWGRFFGPNESSEEINQCGTYSLKYYDENPDTKFNCRITEGNYFVIADIPAGQLRVHNVVSGPVGLDANKENIALGETVTFTPSLTGAGDAAISYKYFINGVETELTNNEWTPSKIGYYVVKLVATAKEQSFSTEKVIQVTKDVTFKVHLTSAAKTEFGTDVYFRYWMAYDGYDHAFITKMTETQDGEWYEATVPALNNVKFLLKNKDGVDDWTDANCSITKTNNEAGYIEDVCFEMTSEKIEGNFNCKDLTDCEYTSYEVTLTVDKDVCKEGETFTFTPGVTGYEDPVTFTYTINGEETVLTNNQFTPSQFGEYTVKVSTTIQGEEYYATKVVKCTRDITLYVYFEQCARDKWGENLYMHYWMKYDGYDHATRTLMTETGNAGWHKIEIAAAYPVKFLLTNKEGVDQWDGERTDNVEGKDNTGYTQDAYFLLDECDNQNKVMPVEATAMSAAPITLTIHFTDQAEETWGDQGKWVRYWMKIKHAESGESFDHTSYVELKESNGVYTASMLAIGGVKFTIQSCNSGYKGDCGEGYHYTKSDMTNNEVGYTESREFRVIDYNAGGHDIEEYTAEQLTIHFNPDGFSTVCWDRTWATEEAEVLVGNYDTEDETLYITTVTDGIVPADKGVILYNPEKANENLVLEGTAASPSDYNRCTNNLKGTTTAISRSTETNVYTYVLAKSDGEPTLLHKYTGDIIPANKAYLEITVPSGNPAPRLVVARPQAPTGLSQDKMLKEPMIKKTIKDGKVIIIRNGVNYNIYGENIK